MRLVARKITTTVLKGCDFALSDAEIVTLRGPSGSGKTLLLRALADLDPHEGEVWLAGTAQTRMSGPEWRRRVRFVSAEPAWWADSVGAHFRDVEAADTAAQSLDLPAGCMDWQVARLSTGEKQRLGFLRAIEDNPAVLLLDEPTAALDPDAERAVETEIRRLRGAGTAILLVTHSDEQERRLADRRFLIDAGRLGEAA